MGEDEMSYPRLTVKPADLRKKYVSFGEQSPMSEDERNHREILKKRRNKQMRKLEQRRMQKKLQQMRRTGRNQ